MSKRSFASDNNAGAHPEMIEAVKAANKGHVIAYGGDPITDRAIKLFKKHFGRDVAVYFVFGGTGANVLGLKAITQHRPARCSAATCR
jgi:threonine aldolase